MRVKITGISLSDSRVLSEYVESDSFFNAASSIPFNNRYYIEGVECIVIKLELDINTDSG